MLLHNLVSSSVETTAQPLVSNHKKEVLCEWVPAKSWKLCSERCEYFQDGSNLLNTGESYGTAESNGKSKRRKVHGNSVLLRPAKSETEAEVPECVIKSFLIPINARYVTNDCFNGSITKTNKCKEDIGKKSLDKENNVSRTEPCSIEKCSSSELIVLGEDISIRNPCTSILRNHGSVVGDLPVSYSASNEILEYNKDSNTFESCELCGELDNTLNMLLCDHCEEAFHASCCNSKTDMLPFDEWFCESCSKSDGRVSLEASFIKSKNISSLNGNSKFRSCPIALMLKYPELHVSRVRIGDRFQAEIPEWPDKVQKDLDSIDEPLELELAVPIGLHVCPPDKYVEHNSTSNWLQCQEVLGDHTGECVEETICGKWRRAPLSEIQTDDWDCSCSIPWDPFHADCTIPQELETDEILLQLKHIDQLKSRIASKRKTFCNLKAER
ncbi:RING/FYVE/PHD zinc finger superfamily protein [Euphorbia peplus]|nr:RING/FYVE/PHD zinc finger superfamily protein [Euphorbia peplus]